MPSTGDARQHATSQHGMAVRRQICQTSVRLFADGTNGICVILVAAETIQVVGPAGRGYQATDGRLDAVPVDRFAGGPVPSADLPGHRAVALVHLHVQAGFDEYTRSRDGPGVV